MRYYCLSLLGLSLLLFGCSDELTDLPFFTVTTEPYDRQDVQLGFLVLRGNLSDTGGELIDDHGFFFSTDAAAVEAGDPSAVLSPSLGPRSSSGIFEDTTESLSEDTDYYFRAYARKGSRMVMGQLEVFRLGLDMSITQVGQRINDTVHFQLTLSGYDSLPIQDIGYVLYQRKESGFEVISDSTSLGTAAVSDFAIVFPDFNADYKIAPYVKASRVYEGEEYAIRIRDGWRRFKDLPLFLAEAAVVETPSKVYVLGGYDLSGTNDSVYALDQSMGSSPEHWGWVDGNIFCNYQGSVGGIGFCEEGTIYAGMGLGSVSSNYSPPLFISGVNGSCFKLADSHFQNTVVFKAAEKWYIGTGHAVMGGDLIQTAQFYTFDPSASQISMEPVTALPLRINGVDLGIFPRESAVTFVADSNRYVGSGRATNNDLKDFFRFIPPASPTDTVRWEYVGSLPDAASGRTEAIAFTVNNRGFVGMGTALGNRYLTDLWEFDPDLGWLECQPLPGAPRASAVAFAVEGWAIVCGGKNADHRLRDCWLYEPAQPE